MRLPHIDLSPKRLLKNSILVTSLSLALTVLAVLLVVAIPRYNVLHPESCFYIPFISSASLAHDICYEQASSARHDVSLCSYIHDDVTLANCHAHSVAWTRDVSICAHSPIAFVCMSQAVYSLGYASKNNSLCNQFNKIPDAVLNTLRVQERDWLKEQSIDPRNFVSNYEEPRLHSMIDGLKVHCLDGVRDAIGDSGKNR